jgi:pimeloyl-ACP methyl ester carboxylesterase
MATSFNPAYIKVQNEGANLNVWHQGTGPLLILIQGGGGDGGRFNAAFPTLSEHYTTATYDRRGNAGSTVRKGRPLNPVESARDVVAIIKTLGFEKASVFGTSSGGLIALQLAASYPEYLDHVIIHEAPTPSLMVGEKTDRVDDAFDVYEIYKKHGPEAALKRFQASVAGKVIPAADLSHQVDNEPKTAAESQQSRPPHRLDYFFEYEFLTLSTYTPPIAQIRANDLSIAIVEGRDSGKVFHATVTRIQAELMACQHIVWPGAHAVFQSHPEEFAMALRDTLVMLDDKGKSRR